MERSKSEFLPPPPQTWLKCANHNTKRFRNDPFHEGWIVAYAWFGHTVPVVTMWIALAILIERGWGGGGSTSRLGSGVSHVNSFGWQRYYGAPIMVTSEFYSSEYGAQNFYSNLLTRIHVIDLVWSVTAQVRLFLSCVFPFWSYGHLNFLIARHPSLLIIPFPSPLPHPPRAILVMGLVSTAFFAFCRPVI